MTMHHQSYKCIHCSETMSSKCPATRNIFPSNQEATMAAHMTHIKPDEESITFHLKNAMPKETFAKKLIEFADFLSKDPERCRIIFCDHEWKKLPPHK